MKVRWEDGPRWEEKLYIGHVGLIPCFAIYPYRGGQYKLLIQLTGHTTRRVFDTVDDAKTCAEKSLRNWLDKLFHLIPEPQPSTHPLGAE